jgi:alkylhydroperoxidase family enzyme
MSEEKKTLMPDYIQAVSQLGLKIKLIQDADATGDTAVAYDEWRAKSGRTQMPGILKCFGQRPDFLRHVMEFSNAVHFAEGHLSRRYKEMIASYVYFLRVQGATDQCLTAVLEGKLDEAGLTPAERALMDYVKLITETADQSTPQDVQKLRDVGWTEGQIAEAVYVTAMFAFFNRVADAFGIPAQNYLVTGKLTP